MILDGWGKSKNPNTSAIDNANTQYIDSLYENFPDFEQKNIKIAVFGESTYNAAIHAHTYA